ncbi:hypothetical protein PRZ48_007254 [Zasmidium cellare]|uniref:Uncharacterized protein n=1 Tax=Zasmidium cellare TaxID=395010 RepID=A0ABR0EJN0_ZASCE|nr:hypothetical protein PRZ48_007254 [Zasmidium cellare]
MFLTLQSLMTLEIVLKLFLQEFNGLGIVLENRYYGASYPFNTSTTDNLRFFTTEQVIADTAHFAQNVILPGHNATLQAPKSLWILIGGSVPGGQVAFAVKEYGNIFWAGLASSGLTKGVLGYPEWYDPIQKFAPQDCTASLNGIIDKIDTVFANGNANQIHHMKSIFGLETLHDNGDFAQTIAYPLGNPFLYITPTWQEINWDPAVGSSEFFSFCHNVTNPNSPKNITALDYALAPYTDNEPWPNLGNYANYIKKYLIPTCGDVPVNNSACFLQHNQSYWADTTNSLRRSYLYTMCTEMGTYTAAHQDKPSLVSRVLKPEYTQQWCTWAFPPGKHNKIPSTPDLERYNVYGGSNMSAPRLAFVGGEQDVFRDVGFFAVDQGERYSLTVEDAYLHPQMLIESGGHRWDFEALNTGNVWEKDKEPQFIREVHLWELRVVARWIGQWEEREGRGSKRDEL